MITDGNGVRYSFGLAGLATGPAIGFPPGIVSTIAGNGDWNYYGDGGPATEAALSYPFRVARDADGNTFIADADNGVVRKVDTNGIITTVAGNNTCGSSGDYGPATSAQVCYPLGVAFDAAGNLYISDGEDAVVRKVDVNGIITTLAGTGYNGYTGDGGAAIQAQLGEPDGLATDNAGSVYIDDYNNCVIRKVDSTGTISTVAGSAQARCGYSGDGGSATSASLGWPEGVAVDNTGNLFIADSDNEVIRKVDTNGVITTVAGDGNYSYGGDGGPATSAQLAYPMSVSVDAAGALFITDSDYNVIRKVDANGIITTVAGYYDGGNYGRQPGKEKSSQPRSKLDHKHVRGLAARKQAHAARHAKAVARQNGAELVPTTDVWLSWPSDAIVDAAGNLYIVDQNGSVVYEADLNTAPLLDFGSWNVGQTSDPQTVTIDNVGNADLQFSQIAVAQGFSLLNGEGSCATGTAVPGSELCTLDAEFIPTVAGIIDGSIVLTSNAVSSPHTIGLTGVAAANDATQLAFGTLPSTVAVGGNLGSVDVMLEDGQGNLASSSSASLSIQIVGPVGFTTYNTTANASAGLATIDLTGVVLSVAGTYTITVSSSGLTTAQVTITVTGTTDFDMTMAAPSVVVISGSGGNVGLTVTPLNGFTGAITLTCSGLPVNSTCSFNPVIVTSDGTGTPLPSILTIHTGVAPSAANHKASGIWFALWMGLPVVGLFSLAGSRRRKMLAVIGASMVVVLAGLLAGCGSSSHPVPAPVTPRGSYTVTVTATAGATSHSDTITLIVQ